MPGKIVVAGGRGMLGRALCPWLERTGCQVTVLTRNPDSHSPSSARQPAGMAEGSTRYVRWDGQTLGAWTGELEGAGALINLAGRSVNCRYTAKHRRQIMDSRILSTRVLAQAIARCRRPPAVWLNSSTATIYRHTFGPPWDEHGEVAATPEANDALSIDVATSWEREFFAAPTPTVRKVALRTAIVLADDPENMITVLQRLVRMGLGGPMGTGRQWVSWVHADDFCRAVDFLIRQPEGVGITGVVNIASPHPLTNRDMMRLFRELCRRRWGLPAPRWLLELGAFLLRTETELVLKSRRVTPGKLLAARLEFRHPDFREALASLLPPHSPRPAAAAGPPLIPSSCESLPPAHEH